MDEEKEEEEEERAEVVGKNVYDPIAVLLKTAENKGPITKEVALQIKVPLCLFCFLYTLLPLPPLPPPSPPFSKTNVSFQESALRSLKERLIQKANLIHSRLEKESNSLLRLQTKGNLIINLNIS